MIARVNKLTRATPRWKLPVSSAHGAHPRGIDPQGYAALTGLGCAAARVPGASPRAEICEPFGLWGCAPLQLDTLNTYEPRAEIGEPFGLTLDTDKDKGRGRDRNP